MFKTVKTLIRPHMYKMVSTFSEPATLTGPKAERANTVYTSIVTYDGMEFDSDEKSMDRMSRYIQVASQTYIRGFAGSMTKSTAYTAAYVDSTVEWKIANNTIVTLTIEQLVEIYELAVRSMQHNWL
jgi:hypothetical protein